jgi:hypothetical protein
MRLSTTASGVALWGVDDGGVRYAQAGGGDAGRRSRDGCRATSNSCRFAARVSTMRRRRSCRPLCGRLVARGGARHSYNGAASRLFGELDLDTTHRAQGEEARAARQTAGG